MAVLQFSTMVPPAAYGGAERVVGWLTDRLEAAGLVVHNAGLGPRAATGGQDQSYPIPNLYWPFDGVSRGVVARSAWHAVDSLLLLARQQVETLFDEVSPSVIVTHNLRGWGLAPWVVARERRVPVIQVVHDYGLICNAATLWRGSPCHGLCRPCSVRARMTQRRWGGGHLVGVSRAVLETFQAYGVELPATTGVAHPVEAAATTAIASTPPNPGRAAQTFGFIGRIVPAKGLELLLEAVRGTDRLLLVAGAGEESYVSSLRDSAPDNVIWLGWVEPEQFYTQIDVLVVPSAWPEPFGLVVVEAAEAGVPVLVADHPGLVEASQASSASFRSFDANDLGSLRSALADPLSAYHQQADPVELLDLVALVTATATRGDAAASSQHTDGS